MSEAKWEKLLGKLDGTRAGARWDDSGNSGANEHEVWEPTGSAPGIHPPTESGRCLLESLSACQTLCNHCL